MRSTSIFCCSPSRSSPTRFRPRCCSCTRLLRSARREGGGGRNRSLRHTDLSKPDCTHVSDAPELCCYALQKQKDNTEANTGERTPQKHLVAHVSVRVAAGCENSNSQHRPSYPGSGWCALHGGPQVYCNTLDPEYGKGWLRPQGCARQDLKSERS